MFSFACCRLKILCWRKEKTKRYGGSSEFKFIRIHFSLVYFCFMYLKLKESSRLWCSIFPLSRCWRPLSHVLTVNFSGINWVLHHVPCIFYLILISSTSFGWVVLEGIHCPMIVEIRENPGRPAHSLPTGLTPPHTWVQYFHWSNVTCS